jgi:hypothetical protein
MDDLAFIRERIESYADYTNDVDRRLSDEQIRAYIGEALARTRERLQPAGSTADKLDALVLRCEFADQREIHAFDVDHIPPQGLARILGADRELARLASGADAVDAAGLDSLLEGVEAALDARFRIITTSIPADPTAPC